MEVIECEEGGEGVDFRKCEECKKLFLAGAIRSTLIHGFTDGRCKSIMTQAIYMLMTYTLCPEHRLRISWYIYNIYFKLFKATVM